MKFHSDKLYYSIEVIIASLEEELFIKVGLEAKHKGVDKKIALQGTSQESLPQVKLGKT